MSVSQTSLLAPLPGSKAQLSPLLGILIQGEEVQPAPGGLQKAGTLAAGSKAERGRQEKIDPEVARVVKKVGREFIVLHQPGTKLLPYFPIL